MSYTQFSLFPEIVPNVTTKAPVLEERLYDLKWNVKNIFCKLLDSNLVVNNTGERQEEIYLFELMLAYFGMDQSETEDVGEHAMNSDRVLGAYAVSESGEIAAYGVHPMGERWYHGTLSIPFNPEDPRYPGAETVNPYFEPLEVFLKLLDTMYKAKGHGERDLLIDYRSAKRLRFLLDREMENPESELTIRKPPHLYTIERQGKTYALHDLKVARVMLLNRDITH